jgi:hypothetical protein
VAGAEVFRDGAVKTVDEGELKAKMNEMRGKMKDL